MQIVRHVPRGAHVAGGSPHSVIHRLGIGVAIASATAASPATPARRRRCDAFGIARADRQVIRRERAVDRGSAAATPSAVPPATSCLAPRAPVHHRNRGAGRRESARSPEGYVGRRILRRQVRVRALAPWNLVPGPGGRQVSVPVPKPVNRVSQTNDSASANRSSGAEQRSRHRRRCRHRQVTHPRQQLGRIRLPSDRRESAPRPERPRRRLPSRRPRGRRPPPLRRRSASRRPGSPRPPAPPVPPGSSSIASSRPPSLPAPDGEYHRRSGGSNSSRGLRKRAARDLHALDTRRSAAGRRRSTATRPASGSRRAARSAPERSWSRRRPAVATTSVM